MTTPWQGLRLDTLDTLFCRDGRPFDAAARVGGGLPTPQTLAGALRTALLARTGFDFQTFSKRLRGGRPLKEALQLDQQNAARQGWVIEARFRGPWLALARKDKPIEPLLPPPATLARKEEGGWLRAEPREENDIPGWTDPQHLLPLWRKGKPDTKAGDGLLTLTGLRAFLDNKDLLGPEFFRTEELHDFDDRTGIRVDLETLTSEDGQIYGIRMLSLKPRTRDDKGQKDDPYHKAEVCLYAEISPGEGAPAVLDSYFAEPVPLGGEGRYVHASPVDACSWPPPDPSRTRFLWYLATPAFFGAGSALPPLQNGLELRAAASGPGVAVSGWDVARNGPRATRFAVPAGAVYFMEGPAPAGGPFRLDDDALAEGWGFALQGAWEKETTT